MFAIFFIGLLIFLFAIFIFKVIFFILGVLLVGAGFIIKSIVILIFFVPILPLLFLLTGGIFSTVSIIFIVACGILISFITQSDKRYNR